jgi:hypothetical protein
MGVMTFGQGHVRHVGAEIDVASGAMMDRVRKMDVMGAARDEVSQVVQCPLTSPMPIGTVLALRAGTSAEIAAALDDFRFGQIFQPRDAFGGVGQIFSGSGHGVVLLENAFQAGKLPKNRSCVIIKTQLRC